MQEVLRALRGIQDLDFELFQVNREYARLPAERDVKREELDRRIHRRDEIDGELKTLQAQIKEIEDHTTMQRQRMRKVEGEAAKSRADAALLAAFQHERQSLRREIGEAEEEGLQFVERADELKARVEALDAEIAEAETVFTEFSGNVDTESAEAGKRLEELNAEREKRLGGSLPPDVLDVYERLLQAREGVALAELDQRVCQGCYMSVPANVFVRLSRAVDLVQCPSCDRILYLPD